MDLYKRMIAISAMGALGMMGGFGHTHNPTPRRELYGPPTRNDWEILEMEREEVRRREEEDLVYKEKIKARRKAESDAIAEAISDMDNKIASWPRQGRRALDRAMSKGCSREEYYLQNYKRYLQPPPL